MRIVVDTDQNRVHAPYKILIQCIRILCVEADASNGPQSGPQKSPAVLDVSTQEEPVHEEQAEDILAAEEDEHKQPDLTQEMAPVSIENECTSMSKVIVKII